MPNAVIGITCRKDIKNNWNYIPEQYVKAVETTGGIPLLIPLLESKECIKEVAKKIDGLLLSGGSDINPVLYKEKVTKWIRKVDTIRDAFEIYITKIAILLGLPILGICRGCQILNVAAGGTLNQHILRHWQKKPVDCKTHEIEIKKGTLLFDAIGKEQVKVNSFHHQSIKTLAPEFKVSAVANNGIIEAIEHKAHKFVLGIQFHAEYLWQNDCSFKNIFSKFVDSCARGATYYEKI
ncbi:MAG: gamma-glutamyl-gamma-aminobutyrate hydrolase family protein [bacterium]|nr:gamma-glutamyl-gamma-aminobutyrate hydrolase family protein [bacterium]